MSRYSATLAVAERNVRQGRLADALGHIGDALNAAADAPSAKLDADDLRVMRDVVDAAASKLRTAKP